MYSRLLSLLLASTILAAECPARTTNARIIGVVTQCVSAHVGTAPLSPGTTIFQGDRLSTEAAGGLSFRSGSSQFYLSQNSAITLGGTEDAALVQLVAGILIFSTAKGSGIEVLASNARIRPPRNAKTKALVDVMNASNLLIAVPQGALQFSYCGQSAALPRGSSFRILLHPCLGSRLDSSRHRQKPPPPGKEPHTLELIAAAVAVPITWIAIDEALESPDRP
jgi:hypothetical protein